MINFKELVFDSENRLDENGNFKFPDCVKKIRIDVGLSNEACHSCEWLLDNEDVAVIGVEANPECQRNLLSGNTSNSYTHTLCLEKERICRFVGYISEVYLKKNLLNLDLTQPENQRMMPWCHIEISGFHYIVGRAFITIGVFRMFPVLEEIKEIKDKYTLIGAAADDIPEDQVETRSFYSTQKDLGTSSLIKEVLTQFPEKGEFEEVKVNCISLDTLLNHIPWDRFEVIEYIKIDAEGKDLDILKGCKKYLHKVVFFKVEAFEITDENICTYNKNNEIIELLEENNFKLIDKGPADYKFINKLFLDRSPGEFNWE